MGALDRLCCDESGAGGGLNPMDEGCDKRGVVMALATASTAAARFDALVSGLVALGLVALGLLASLHVSLADCAEKGSGTTRSGIGMLPILDTMPTRGEEGRGRPLGARSVTR